MARPIGSKNAPKYTKLNEILSRPFKDPENAVERLINFQMEKQVAMSKILFEEQNWRQFDVCQRTLLDLVRFTNEIQIAKKGINQKIDLSLYLEKLGIKEEDLDKEILDKAAE